MENHTAKQSLPTLTGSHTQRVLVATTAMLAFISFWRAAAIVLNDMGSSAFYAGAIAEHFVGKAAPWFILAIMLLSYAVRSVYIESCSMFVRGGVYRVVKEAMGGTLAKFSVSALMFDYILTGPISGVSAGLYLVGPLSLRLAFRAFVVVVGVLMLAGAVNTAIVGSNGVLNRVSEDGILPYWFRRPQRRFGTSYRILNLVVGLQLLTIFLSRGNIFLLGEAYAFGVMWSFAMKGLAVLVLRYKQPGKREFRVPLNLMVGGVEIPVGLGLITVTLVALCVINLFTKQIATLSGVAFTIIFFVVFEVSEKMTKRSAAAHTQLDQFNLEPGDDLTPKGLGVRPENILVMVRNYNTLYNLGAVLDRVDPRKQDVVVLHMRFLVRAESGEGDLAPEQLFSVEEQDLFTRALALAEKKGKTIHLAVAAATEKWDGILRAAQSLQSSAVVLGPSPTRPVTEEARIAGLAWERLPDPKPRLILEIYFPGGQEHIFYVGPHVPRLTPKEIDLLHGIWLELSGDVAPEEIHHHDVVHFALQELQQDLSNAERESVLRRLRLHLEEIKDRRASSS
jgi:hypothetical protein